MNDPLADQKKAQIRDLQRLRELMHPYVTSTAEDFRDALPRMPASERAEAEALIASTAHEDPEKATARQETLLRYAQLAEIAQAVADDDTQTPAVRRKARKALAGINRDRDRLAGLPPAGDNNGH